MRKFLEKITKEAGERLKESFKKDKELIGLRKTSKEAAVKYDKTIDEFIVGKIRQKHPTHSILSEESGFKRGDSSYLWIVDSLDGTGNFANQNPFFSVCIALLKEKELLFSAIYAPAIEEFYFAEKGKGAFLNNKKIKVSSINRAENSYVVYCEGAEKNKKRLAKIINNIYPNVTDVRKIGSAGIETGWIACGKSDAYFTTKIEPWDVAAGILLIKEAGGMVSDFKGNQWKIKNTDLFCSNGKVHKEILDLLSNL